MTKDSLKQAIEAHKRGDLQAAEAGYRTVLRDTAKDPTALHMLGVVLLNTGRTDSAIETLQSAIHANPNNAEIWFDLGMAHRSSGLADRALNDFQRALSINQDLHAAVFQMGQLHKAAKRWDDAQQSFQDFVGEVPDQPHGHIDLGHLAHRVGNLRVWPEKNRLFS